MKYKIKHEKSNKAFMSSVFILSLVTCLFWIVLREYIYCIIFLILTLLLGYIYYCTYYYLKDDKLVIKLGFINFSVKYTELKKIENLNNSIKIYFKNISLNIYPNNKDIFYGDILNKMKGNK